MVVGGRLVSPGLASTLRCLPAPCTAGLKMSLSEQSRAVAGALVECYDMLGLVVVLALPGLAWPAPGER